MASSGGARTSSCRRADALSRPFLFGGMQLLEGALLGRLVRTPAHELGAMAKAVAGNMVISNLAHQLGLERLPFRRPRIEGIPPAGPSRRFAGEPWAAVQWF